MYEISKDKPFYYSLTMLTYTLAIPNRTDKRFLRFFYLKLIILKFCSIVIITVLPSLHLLESLKGNNNTSISADVSTTLGCTTIIITRTFFTFQYHNWLSFFKDLEDCRKFGNHPDEGDLRKRLNFFSKLYGAYICIGIWLYALPFWLEISTCKRINEEHGLHEVCGVLFPITPFFVDGVFGVIAVNLIHLLIANYNVLAAGIACFVVYESAEILIFHILNLKRNFEQVFDVQDAVERRKRLILCVKCHVHLLRLSKKLNIIQRKSVGHLSLVSAIIFGCITNDFLQTRRIGPLIFLIGYVVSTFLLCHAGQRLSDETLSIGNAVYNSKWYEGDAEIMKDVQFIIARCQIPQYLEALPLGACDYTLFLMLIKTSYSYLALLQQST